VTTDHSTRTAVVTGASSGVGHEAAAQLARAGYHVIVTARTDAKAERSRAELRASEGFDAFEALTLDLDDPASTAAAAHALAGRGDPIDVLLLNAGIPPTRPMTRTSEGIEAIAAATLIGHHRLTMRLLHANALSGTARIVIAGSEAARGDVPMMNPIDVDQLAARHFDGDRERAVEAILRMQPPVKYHPNNQYATVKMFAAWWAAELATRLPAGMTVNAVSPGSTPETNVTTKMPPLERRVLVPIMSLIPGMSHSVSTAAARYLEASNFTTEKTGMFFASKPKRMTGPLHHVQTKPLSTPDAQRALWTVTERIAAGPGAPDPQPTAQHTQTES
jgi:NAD(P)-dependent dehydrogenase (short-subunit alcohol dehydrogenase family)